MEEKDKVFNIEFKADVTGSIEGQAFTYSVEEDTFTASYADGSSEKPLFSIHGKVLIMRSEDGAPKIFNRVDDSGSQPGSGGAKKDPRKEPEATLKQGLKTVPFEVHTFNVGFDLGYPKGWKATGINVQESGTVEPEADGSIVILTAVENRPEDAAVIQYVMMKLSQDVKSSSDLAKTMINRLFKKFPGVKMETMEPHHLDLHMITTDVSFTSKGVAYKGHMWSPMIAEGGMGLVVFFYCPQQRYDSFNEQSLLFTCLYPYFGDGMNLVGRWNIEFEGEVYEMVFTADANVTVGGEKYRYLARGDSVVFIASGGMQEIKYRIRGNKLVFIGKPGGEEIWEWAGEAPRPDPIAPPLWADRHGPAAD
jgi:hypothetical protein